MQYHYPTIQMQTHMQYNTTQHNANANANNTNTLKYTYKYTYKYPYIVLHCITLHCITFRYQSFQSRLMECTGARWLYQYVHCSILNVRLSVSKSANDFRADETWRMQWLQPANQQSAWICISPASLFVTNNVCGIPFLKLPLCMSQGMLPCHAKPIDFGWLVVRHRKTQQSTFNRHVSTNRWESDGFGLGTSHPASSKSSKVHWDLHLSESPRGTDGCGEVVNCGTCGTVVTSWCGMEPPPPQGLCPGNYTVFVNTSSTLLYILYKQSFCLWLWTSVCVCTPF